MKSPVLKYFVLVSTVIPFLNRPLNGPLNDEGVTKNLRL